MKLLFVTAGSGITPVIGMLRNLYPATDSGVLRLARTARVRWEPVCLLAGVLIAVTGFALPASGLFMLGVLVLIVTLLKGLSAQQRRRDPAR